MMFLDIASIPYFVLKGFFRQYDKKCDIFFEGERPFIIGKARKAETASSVR